MRTTISIPDDLRARLLRLAGKRGKKGYSDIVCEALEEYLAKEEDREKLIDRALKLEGILTSEEAENTEKRIKELWDRWSL